MCSPEAYGAEDGGGRLAASPRMLDVDLTKRELRGDVLTTEVLDVGPL
jgi:hypothetical protein